MKKNQVALSMLIAAATMPVLHATTQTVMPDAKMLTVETAPIIICKWCEINGGEDQGGK